MWKGQGEEREICCSTYLLILWLIFVCALSGYQTHNLGISGRRLKLGEVERSCNLSASKLLKDTQPSLPSLSPKFPFPVLSSTWLFLSPPFPLKGLDSLQNHSVYVGARWLLLLRVLHFKPLTGCRLKKTD